MPRSPSAPSLRHKSAGNSFERSISSARGAISFAAKSRTDSRSMSMVSPCSNLRKFIREQKTGTDHGFFSPPRRFAPPLLGEEGKSGKRGLSLILGTSSFRCIRAVGKRHQGLLHGSDVGAVVSVHLGARHRKRATGPD